MKKEPLYILTYDHGGYVLWKDEVKPRLREIKRWMKEYKKLRIGLDYESFTFDEFSRSDPEVVRMIGELLRDYPDRVGLGATTYGQPLSLYISEESNIRQLTYAVKTNLHYFGITPDVYCISEFALNSQSPQMLKLCGYKAAILRSHVMGYGYTKTFDVPWGRWIGKDKTEIPAVPTYHKQGRGYNCTTVDNWILSRWPRDLNYSLDDFRDMFSEYSPLLASRYDDLTQDIEDITRHIEEREDFQYVLLEDIPDLYGEAKHPLELGDNDFHSQMPWGYCGNEIFCGCRKGEVEAAQAEKLNALSVIFGGEALQEKTEEAWKHILAAQHHDVTICGLLDLARRFIPSSLSFSEEVKNSSLCELEKVFSHKENKSLFVSNPHSFPIDTWIKTEIKEELYPEGCEGEIISEDGKNYLISHIRLRPLETKSIALKEKKQEEKTAFIYNEKLGYLETPLYRFELTARGIKALYDKRSEKTVFSHSEGALFSGNVNGIDRVSEGKWEVFLSEYRAKAVYSGNIGEIPFEFVMEIYPLSPEISCRSSFTLHGERVGRNDITEGRPVPLTVSGHHHQDKICFTAQLQLSRDREMFRDLPFSIAKWNGDIRKTEKYWYPDDDILIDTPVSEDESFESITQLQGVYWVCLRDSENGFAVINKGAMGSSVHGNRLYIPLIYANEYLCGTKMLDGTYTSEFTLLPFLAETDNIALHKKALEINYPVVNAVLGKGEGNVKEFTFAEIENADKEIILTAFYPEDDYITVRFCNYSDKASSMEFSMAKYKEASETDLLGNILNKVTDGKLSFRPWEIKTLKIVL